MFVVVPHQTDWLFNCWDLGSLDRSPYDVVQIIIIITNVLIRVTLHTKVLQGHFTQLTQKHCRSSGTKATD